jgi:hypothetical protein
MPSPASVFQKRMKVNSNYQQRVPVKTWRGATPGAEARWLRPVPIAPGGCEAIDTVPLPVKHPSRVPGMAGCAWAGPADQLLPCFGYCAALDRWFYGFRLGRRIGLTDGLIRGWAIVPAAVDERCVADGLLDGARDICLLTDQGFRSAQWARCGPSTSSPPNATHITRLGRRWTRTLRPDHHL